MPSPSITLCAVGDVGGLLVKSSIPKKSISGMYMRPIVSGIALDHAHATRRRERSPLPPDPLAGFCEHPRTDIETY